MVLAVEIAHVGHQLAPLAGQQVDHVDPFGRPSSMADMGERKWTCVSAVTQPCSRQGSTFSISMTTSCGLGGHLDHLPHRPDLEPFGDLEVHLAQRQLELRLAGDVGAGMSPGPVGPIANVGKVHAVVLEPGRVEDAMAVHRGQVLAPLAVDVQLDRDRLTLLPRSTTRSLTACSAGATGWMGSPGWLLSTWETGIATPSRQVEAGFRVGGVLDQDLVGGDFGSLVVVSIRPGIVRIHQARRGRDDLSQVELHLLEQAVFVQVGLESFSRRKGQAGFPARLPAQGQRCGGAGRYGRQDRQPLPRLEAEAGDGLLGAGFSQAHSQFTHGPSSPVLTRVCVHPQSSLSCSWAPRSG